MQPTLDSHTGVSTRNGNLFSWRELMEKTPLQLQQENIDKYAFTSYSVNITMNIIVVADIIIILGGAGLIIGLNHFRTHSVYCFVVHAISLASLIFMRRSYQQSLSFSKGWCVNRLGRVGIVVMLWHLFILLSLIILTDLHTYGVSSTSIDCLIECVILGLKAFALILVMIIYQASQEARKQMTKLPKPSKEGSSMSNGIIA